MRAIDVIQRKRDGYELTPEELSFFVDGHLRGDIPDYQAAAWAMAVRLRGMSPAETANLAQVMLHSGVTVDLSGLAGPKVDKHSTGGVGDKTSLVAAPLAAACGVLVPMIAGRGLGHTGGTLDKLEAVPGLRVRLSQAEFLSVIERCGVCIAGQTEEIAPADRRLYALRDVTGTIDSIPLIAASIMSKKLAVRADALVLDVKCGDGAFMRDIDQANSLAQALISIGRAMGRPMQVLITDMGQPLGHAVGNALEVAEAINTLKGRGPRDVESLSLELAARMVLMSDPARTLDAARGAVRGALTSGAGLARLRALVEAQGGDPSVCDDTERLPHAKHTTVVRAAGDGRLTRIACRMVGDIAQRLGAGRETLASHIDPTAGLIIHKKVGELVIADEPLATLHASDPALIEICRPLIETALEVGPEAPPPIPLVRRVVEAGT
jgi:pyrimidine-nucleoside phosphorylase